MQSMASKKYLNWLTYQIVGCAIDVHKILGPGLLEKNYEQAFCHELALRGIQFSRQCSIEVEYKGYVLPLDLRYDVLVEELIVVELKAVPHIVPVFESQLMTYMHHLKIPKGVLINFNVVNIYSEGVSTRVNKHFQILPDE
jgi:GxxExxY protein